MLFLKWYLWIAPNALLVPCLVGLFRRGFHRRFPLFLGYIAAQLVLFFAALVPALLILFSPSYLSAYRWVLVIGTGVSAILELAVIYELGNELLLTRSFLASIVRPLLQWVGALLLLLAAASSALLPDAGIDKLTRCFQMLDFSASLLIVGLLLAVFLFTRALHLSWRSLPTGIALGFGIIASAEISASALISVLGKSGYVTVDLIRMAASHIGTLMWAIYVFVPEQPANFVGTGLQKPELEFWDQELQRMVPP